MQEGLREDLDSARTLLVLGSGIFLSRALWAAVRLGVADKVGPQGAQIEEIAEQVGADADALGRLLALLMSQGVFARGEDGRVVHTPASRMLRRDHPLFQAALYDFYLGDEAFAAWGALETTLRTGKAGFEIAQGVDQTRYERSHPDYAQRKALAEQGEYNFVAPLLLAGADFGAFDCLVALGVDSAAFARAIAARRPQARAILVDSPASVAALTAGSAEITGLEIVAAAVEAPLPAGDLYLVKNLLHKFDDAGAGRILAELRAAIRPGGRLAIVEAMLPDAPTGLHPAWLLDLRTLVMDGGRERSRDAFGALLKANGFRLQTTTKTPGAMSILVAVPT